MTNPNNFTPGLSFFTVTQYRHTQGHVCDFRQSPRPHYCMGFIEVGEGVFESEEERIPVRPGEIIFVPMGSCYRSVWHGAPEVCYTSMHFFFDGMPPFDSTRHLPLQKLRPADAQAVSDLYQKALSLRCGTHAEHLIAVGLFYQLLGEVLPQLQYGIGKKRDERMETAAQYLQQHYRDPIVISELAALCHMSPSHFHACFQKTFGMTPIAYKHRVCIRHAILELMRGKVSVEEISSRLGFESAIYFRRVFKKVTGKSPTAYLKTDVE